MLIFAAVSLYSLLLLYAFKHRFMPTAGSFGNAAAFLAGPVPGVSLSISSTSSGCWLCSCPSGSRGLPSRTSG